MSEALVERFNEWLSLASDGCDAMARGERYVGEHRGDGHGPLRSAVVYAQLRRAREEMNAEPDAVNRRLLRRRLERVERRFVRLNSRA